VGLRLGLGIFRCVMMVVFCFPEVDVDVCGFGGGGGWCRGVSEGPGAGGEDGAG
jgi:hypothetical protein